MKFTEEHKVVLDRNRHHWETLKAAGYMRNLDRPVFDELQNVHNEALEPAQYLHWCSACVADMVRILYTNYEKWLSTQCAYAVGAATGGSVISPEQAASFASRAKRDKRR